MSASKFPHVLEALIRSQRRLQKCDLRLMAADTPLSCRPRTYCAASFPVKMGSSENDSKFLPPTGCRCKHTVGPSRMLADRAFVSSPRCWPTVSSRSLFHVAASEIPQGNKAALVPPTKILPRAPFGPSVVLADGIPFSGIAFVRQKSQAVRSEIWTRRPELETQYLIETRLRKDVSRNLPFHPVSAQPVFSWPFGEPRSASRWV